MEKEIIIQVEKENNETSFHINNSNGEAKQYIVELIEEAMKEEILTLNDIEDIIIKNKQAAIISTVDDKHDVSTRIVATSKIYLMALLATTIKASAEALEINQTELLQTLVDVDKFPFEIQEKGREQQSLIDERIALALSAIPERPSKKALNAKEAAEYIGYSKAWLLKNKDALPPRLSNDPIRYHIDDLDQWLQMQRSQRIEKPKRVGKVNIRPVRKEKAL